MEIKEALIRVHREWNGCGTAEIRLGDLQQIHWYQPPGAPRPLVHGYVSCTSIINGDIRHECSGADAPHRLRVCVLKKHTLPAAYVELAQRASVRTIVAGERTDPSLAAMR